MNWMHRILLLAILIVASCDFQNEPVFPDYPWDFAQPEKVGFNADTLLAINQSIQTGTYGQLKSLLIIKNDKLIFENYYNLAHRSQQDDLFGSTTSVTSILLGIALEKNIIPSLDAPIKDLMPSYQSAFEDPLRAQITVKHLVSMKPGISWNELLRSINDPANIINEMVQTTDWSDFALGKPMEAIPGTRFSYNSGGLMVLSKIFEEQIGMSLADFAEDNLFQPLGISATWTADPSGTTNAAWGLSLKPLDMAKLGYLSLNHGNWFGEQIIDKEYADLMGEIESQYTFSWDYGLGWWRFSDSSNLVDSIDENDIFFSWGLGGQFIFIIPHLEMVVVLTAENFLNNDELGIQLLIEELIPAITNGTI